MKTKAKVEIKKTTSGNQKGAWRYTVKAANGETLVTSEGYTTKADAERGLLDLTTALLEHLGDRFRGWARRHMK
jgi:uncharacterized protein YegP (UPF0339 family)